MNTSSVHSTGALLLEPMNQLVIEVKMVHKAAIPLTYDTPAEKLKCELTIPAASCTDYCTYYSFLSCIHTNVFNVQRRLKLAVCSPTSG